MSHQAITILCVVGGLMLLDLMIVPPLIKSGWSALGDRFAPKPIPDDAIRKNFRSIAIGIFNFGSCVHIAVDRDHLHLIPAALLRWAGCKTASVPWTDISITRRKGKWIDAKAGRTALRAPAWCLEFAEPATPAADLTPAK